MRRLESLNGTDHSEDIAADRRIILKLILGKYFWMIRTGFFWPRIGSDNGPL